MIYEVITAETPAELARAVNIRLASGWQIVGGVAVAVVHRTWTNERKCYKESATDTEYAQAMTDPNSHLLVASAGRET